MKTYRIAVLGSTGMLGFAVGKYFSERSNRYDVSLSLRDARRGYAKNHFEFSVEQFLENPHLDDGFDYVINCIGAIKQRQWSREQLIKVNSLFPLKLAEYCHANGARLIHATTDCVYSGKKGSYCESDIPDPPDDYGCTKLLGEPNDCMVLRTSFVGEELHGGYSLLEWAKRQDGKTITGYTNHRWNGITTLQFAKVCDTIINDDLYVNAVRHVFNPISVTKFQMLSTFQHKFKLRYNLVEMNHDLSVDRTLSTMYDLNSKLCIPTFHKMVEEL